MKTVITISRQYGSGGREIGKKLAEQLGIPFYDNEIISRAAKETGFSEAAFESVEDKATNSLLYSIAMGMNVFTSQDTGFAGLSLDDRIFLAQSNVIRKVAEEGACVIVGRCADYILKDLDDIVNVSSAPSRSISSHRKTLPKPYPKRIKAVEIITAITLGSDGIIFSTTTWHFAVTASALTRR